MSQDISNILSNYDGIGIGDLVRNKEIKPIEIYEEAVNRTLELNPKLNFLWYEGFEEGRKMANNPNLPDGPFKGVPWLVKELASMWEGLPLHNHCPYLKDGITPFDSYLVKQIKKSGFLLLGKSIAPEMGWALSSEPKMHGPVKSPWDLNLTPGGSSGGSAAAVAARVTPISDASDGGGSIRVPASYCGLVGLKPSKGRVSLSPALSDYWYGGAIFLCVSRTVRDTAAFLEITGGSLPGDPYYMPLPKEGFLPEVTKDPGKLKIAFVDESPEGCTSIDPEVKDGLYKTAKKLEELGHQITKEKIPYDFWELNNAYTNITTLQTSAFFDNFETIVGRKIKEGDTENLYWTMYQKGKTFSGHDHSNHVENLRQICRNVIQKMNEFDVWMTPVTPMTPRKLGYYDMSLDVDTYNNTIMGPDCPFTSPFNATGLPAISLPLHFTKNNIPVGIQFISREADDKTLFRLAGQLEINLPWKDKKPPISF